jgi:hypothetical protein
MRSDREKATELRRIGKTYRSIQAELGVPMSTLSQWFSGSEWSGEVRKKQLKNTSELSARMRELNDARGKRLVQIYEKAKVEAKREMETLKRDPLFVSGMMLYWNSGDKASRGKVQFYNSDPVMVQFFLKFLTKTCGVSVGKIRASLQVAKDTDEASARRFWVFAIGLPPANFTKTAITKAKSTVHRSKELRYGVCTLTVSSTYLKLKIGEWLTLLPKDLMK